MMNEKAILNPGNLLQKEYFLARFRFHFEESSGPLGLHFNLEKRKNLYKSRALNSSNPIRLVRESTPKILKRKLLILAVRSTSKSSSYPICSKIIRASQT